MSDKFCLDANTLIASWNTTYPKDVFPSLYEQLVKNKEKIILIEPIYNEIKKFSPIKSTNNEMIKINKEFYKYILDNFNKEPIKEKEFYEDSLSLMKKYKIDPSRKTKGANKNDVLLICYAKHKDLPVVTQEKKQHQKPKEKADYRIPLICKEEKIDCFTFLEFLREINIEI